MFVDLESLTISASFKKSFQFCLDRWKTSIRWIVCACCFRDSEGLQQQQVVPQLCFQILLFLVWSREPKKHQTCESFLNWRNAVETVWISTFWYREGIKRGTCPPRFFSFPEVVSKDNTNSMSGFFDVRCVRISAFSMEWPWVATGKPRVPPYLCENLTGCARQLCWVGSLRARCISSNSELRARPTLWKKQINTWHLHTQKKAFLRWWCS